MHFVLLRDPRGRCGLIMNDSSIICSDKPESLENAHMHA